MSVHRGEVEPGKILHVQDSDEFVKVDSVHGNKVTGYTVTPDYDDDPEQKRTVPLNRCDKCMSTHQFGQHKRFTPGGRGFSKQGRRLKHNRSTILDNEAREFILGEISSEEFLEKDNG